MDLTGLGASLAINAYRTLRLLVLKFTVERDRDDNYGPLCKLTRELRFIAGDNVLEELKLDVMVRLGASRRIESEDCSDVDSLLTEFGAFPMLHRVMVKIWWYLREDDGNGFSESLMEDKFPRLADSKAVESNFFTEVYYE